MNLFLSESILGYKVSTACKEDCNEQILAWMTSGDIGKYIVCANPHSLEVARGDSVFHEAIHQADLVVPDGFGIVLASRIQGGQIRERITGSDIFWGLNSALNQTKRHSVFFLGSTVANLARIHERIRADFPNITVAGVYSPPFKPEFSAADNERMVTAVNEVQPDVLWVGMTAPKQEKWIFQNRHRLQVKVIGAIGAVFDFYSGNVKRPHPIFQKSGLEWLPRLIQEPRRLWKRNIISNPAFLSRVLLSRIRK